MLGSLVAVLSALSRKLIQIIKMSKERTFIAVKPDGVQRGIVGEIIKRFEAKGFKLAGMKFLQASEDHLKKHYADLSDKPFFAGLVKYMASGPLVAMCWEGTGIVKTARQMMGETKPADSKPGTIRGDFCIEVGRNIIHGSDSVESAEKEISLWFKPEELVSWTQAAHDWIYEFHGKHGPCNKEAWLSSLNSYLQDRSYIQFYVPSRIDFVVFFNVNRTFSGTSYPHLRRWYNHIQYICDELQLNAAHYEFCKIDQNRNKQNSISQVEAPTKTLCYNVIGEQNNFHVEQKEIEDTSKKECSPSFYAVLLEVKPKDEEIDINEMENIVREVAIDGLAWGASRLSHLAYGLKKLSILCTLQDDKVSIQDVLQKLIKFENYILSVDIAGFNKL